MSATDSSKDELGAIVKARTLALQKTSSNLARRAIQHIDRLATDPRVSELIRQMVSSPDWKDRGLAWTELGKMGPTYRGWVESLRNTIYTGDGWARIMAAETLARHGCNPDDAVPVLVTLLECCLDDSVVVDSQTNNDWARLACGAIGLYQGLAAPLTGIAVPALLGALESSDYSVSGNAAKTLSQFGNDALCAIPKIIALAKTKDDWLKDIFWAILREFHSSIQDPIDALLLAASSLDPKVRGEAVCEIAKSGAEGFKAIPQLLTLENDESQDVRRFLAIALGRLGQSTDKTVNVLNTLSHDPDDSVKVGALYSLVCLGENRQSNLHQLLGLLSHSDSFVRYLSAWAVGEIGCIDRDNTNYCLIRALQLEDHPRNKDLMAESIEKIRRC